MEGELLINILKLISCPYLLRITTLAFFSSSLKKSLDKNDFLVLIFLSFILIISTLALFYKKIIKNLTKKNGLINTLK